MTHATEIIWKSFQRDGEGRSFRDTFLFIEIYTYIDLQHYISLRDSIVYI